MSLLPTASHPRRVHSPLQQDTATFLELAEETGGRRTLLEIELAPGGGNQPHRHLTYAERFEVLQGTLTVHVGGAEVRLGPGERATAPIRSVHSFRNDSGAPVLFRVALEPGHRGFERSIQAAYGLQADGRTDSKGIPRNPLVLALLLEWSDMALVGPRASIGPLAGVLARIARRRGVDRELEARYIRF